MQKKESSETAAQINNLYWPAFPDPPGNFIYLDYDNKVMDPENIDKSTPINLVAIPYYYFYLWLNWSEQMDANAAAVQLYTQQATN